MWRKFGKSFSGIGAVCPFLASREILTRRSIFYSDVFDKYANKESQVLGMNEVAEMFIEISKRMTALPAVRHLYTCFSLVLY